MHVLTRPWGAMHFRDDGPRDGLALVFANSLGTDLRLWDGLMAHLPAGLRLIRHDLPGHGLSQDGGAVSIASLAEDVAALIKATAARPVIFIGLSIGGLIGQALAAARPDLLRALVLSNSAARIGTPESWAERIAAVSAGGTDAIADAVMARWFAPAFRATPALALWRTMLARTPAAGYAAACAAIAAADLTATTRALRLPVLAIAGAEDGAMPPALVRATADLIAGAAFHVIPGVGHLPCVENPSAYAEILNQFLKDNG